MSEKVKFYRGKSWDPSKQGEPSGQGEIVFINEAMGDATTVENYEFNKNLGSIYQDDKIVGTTRAEKLMTTEAITVQGGPLANNIAETGEEWPFGTDTAGNKTIPAGTSIQEILSKLFLKEVEGSVKWGSITWDPVLGAPTATLSPNGTVEVGSNVTATIAANQQVSGNTRSATCTTTQGYFESVDGTHKSGNRPESKTGTEGGTATTTHTWNTVATTSTTLMVSEGTNTLVVTNTGRTASVEALPEITIYASTNTKKCLPNIKDTLKDETPATKTLTSTAQATVTGSYYYFCGNISGISADLITPENVRKLNQLKGFVSTVSTSGTDIGDPHVNGSSTYVIALPEGYSVASAKFFGNPAGIEKWPTKEIYITLPNGNTKKYTCYYEVNGGSGEYDYTNLTIKK